MQRLDYCYAEHLVPARHAEMAGSKIGIMAVCVRLSIVFVCMPTFLYCHMC